MEERSLKVKIIALLAGIALLVGVLSGCVEEEPTETENVEPTADFTYTTDNTTVAFEDGSSDTDGNITGWSWDFGDGNTSTLQNPEHTYDEDDKVYTVTLTVTDDDDATDTITKDVTVGTPPLPPTAAFTYEPMDTNITVNATITFTDNSTIGSSNITSWMWDFGDGNTSTLQNPEHNYSAADTYTVTLTVTDENELTDTATVEITVTEEETS